ncbi:hypothetical protein [Candidatus Harpocratesius sp.]
MPAQKKTTKKTSKKTSPKKTVKKKTKKSSTKKTVKKTTTKSSKRTSTKKTTKTSVKKTTPDIEVKKKAVEKTVQESIKKQEEKPVEKTAGKEIEKTVTKKEIKKDVKKEVKKEVKIKPAEKASTSEKGSTSAIKTETVSKEEPNKFQQTWDKMKTSVAMIPTGIKEQQNKLKITTSKLFALTGALFAFFEGRRLFLTYNFNPVFTVIVGAFGMLIGLFLIITILTDLILAMKAIQGKIPYEWYILLLSGIIITILNSVVVGGSIFLIKGGVILMIGGIILLLEGLKIKKMPNAKTMVTLFGIVIGLYETVMVVVVAFTNIWAWITAFIMLVLLAILFFATELIKLPEKIRPPLTWWVTLSIGIAMYYFGFQLSGIVILHVFLLILIDL